MRSSLSLCLSLCLSLVSLDSQNLKQSSSKLGLHDQYMSSLSWSCFWVMMQMILNPCGWCYTTTTAITRAQQHQYDLQAKTVYLSLSLSLSLSLAMLWHLECRLQLQGPAWKKNQPHKKNTKPRGNSINFLRQNKLLKELRKNRKLKTWLQPLS